LCRKFALSDPVDEDFKHQGSHDDLSKYDSGEELNTVLQSEEGKSMNFALRGTPKNNMITFFGKSVNFINEWKCHIL